MEPLTAGAIALLTLLLNKTFEKSGELIVAKAFEQVSKVYELLMHKHPDLSRRLAAAKENPALPSQQPEDYGEAVLIEDIKSAAADPKIKAAIEELAAQVEEAPKNSQWEKAFTALAEVVQAQKQNSPNPAKIAEKIGIYQQINKDKVYQTIEGNIIIHETT
ncbi:hypothetical protein [Microseira wollei]|uniref:Uncharacterized protein n=1 Tax=Microseira wollei NIES-4236 TaxID=2530354 RepID=A0AAV3XN37_9CYAN|nr:hypothetical protein [Microseira wollei]GET42191.1 hypothetical protein MiSe_70050 [Microseira wollei NIES-4236]